MKNKIIEVRYFPYNSNGKYTITAKVNREDICYLKEEELVLYSGLRFQLPKGEFDIVVERLTEEKEPEKVQPTQNTTEQILDHLIDAYNLIRVQLGRIEDFPGHSLFKSEEINKLKAELGALKEVVDSVYERDRKYTKEISYEIK